MEIHPQFGRRHQRKSGSPGASSSGQHGRRPSVHPGVDEIFHSGMTNRPKDSKAFVVVSDGCFRVFDRVQLQRQ
ncbi:Hypothetical protein SMAX5B_019657 [Scophthalmus maximus]|uniref:Uncharacterized protein n=1 Tax=Scophthalmus maximus TaxID=52904 RepID=A0A2U9CVF7_SCOMX|nr:Hypothetical protein SMAX5B_019657 [Scophthalmus maximus]